MAKEAINIDEQISLLRQRGMIIDNEDKAKEVLSDVGYYRLGFYWFPFERSYPCKVRRTHEFREGTNFDDIVRLYYFDFKLRGILTRYLNRIEINLRTFLTYYVSNYYKTSPTWFVDPSIVTANYIQSFDQEVYTSRFKRTPVIKQHHQTHINDKYAPAWKTLEFMTLGSVIHLFRALKNQLVRRRIGEHFGIKQLVVFESYLCLINTIRNYCAHGNVLYDIALPVSIRRGPAGKMEETNYQNLYGAIKVIYYMIGIVSQNRQADLKRELSQLFDKYNAFQEVQKTIVKATGIKNIGEMLG